MPAFFRKTSQVTATSDLALPECPQKAIRVCLALLDEVCLLGSSPWRKIIREGLTKRLETRLGTQVQWNNTSAEHPRPWVQSSVLKTRADYSTGNINTVFVTSKQKRGHRGADEPKENEGLTNNDSPRSSWLAGCLRTLQWGLKGRKL